MSNEAPARSYFFKNWTLLAMVLGGIALVAIAAWIGQKYDILHQLTLEASGTRGMATAEPLGTDEFRLRLPLDSAVYTRSYKGKLSGANPESYAEFSVPVVFDPAEPRRFLPSGRSYTPAVITALLFLLGMTCVLMARRAAHAAESMQRMSRLRAEEERKRKKHRRKHRDHRREHQHGASNWPV